MKTSSTSRQSAVCGLQPVAEGVALDELHRDEHRVAERPDVVDHHHVRVRQPRDRLGLAQQTRAPARRSGSRRALEQLDRDLAIQLRDRTPRRPRPCRHGRSVRARRSGRCWRPSPAHPRGSAQRARERPNRRAYVTTAIGSPDRPIERFWRGRQAPRYAASQGANHAAIGKRQGGPSSRRGMGRDRHARALRAGLRAGARARGRALRARRHASAAGDACPRAAAPVPLAVPDARAGRDTGARAAREPA